MISHRAISNRIMWGRTAHPLAADDAMLQNTSFSFDVSIWEIFASLLSGTGTRLVISPPSRGADPELLASLIRRERVTTVGFVPAVLRQLLDAEALADGETLRHVFVGGEELTAELRERCLRRLPAAKLYNLYGLSETTIDATHYACVATDVGSPTPIGIPMGNMRCYVLDASLAPVGVGAVGELFIAGVGLARGYLARPDLTAERFLPDPFSPSPGARMYRTGDRARWRYDGNLEFLGRLDRQVKIRGVRVEPAEVEAILRQHPSVKDVALVVHSAERRQVDGVLERLLDEIEALSDAQVEAEFERLSQRLRQLDKPAVGLVASQVGDS
jgi:amino acid adenylation domain-containing protein